MNPNPNTLSNNTTARDRIEGKISMDRASEISIGDTGALRFTDASQLMELAKIVSVAGVAIPKHLRDNPGACMAVIIQASEWKMSPFAVANKSYSVNDRLAYESQLIAAVILRRAPIKSRFRVTYSGEGDTLKCKVAVTTTDDEIVEYESPPFGLIQPKNSPLWKNDPQQQLYYYSSRALCRRHFPDVLLGLYAIDELQDAPPMERQATGRVVTETAPRIENPYRETFADLPDPVKESEPEPQAEPEPEPEPQPTGEAPPESPVEVSDETERKALVADIKAAIKSTECGTFALFAPKCREAGLLAPGVQLAAAPIESLREILANVADIAAGQYVPIA